MKFVLKMQESCYVLELQDQHTGELCTENDELFVLNMMNSASIMMDSVLKMMNYLY